MPQHALSRFAGLLANCHIPRVKNVLIRYFLSQYSVNLNEAVESDAYAYACFNDFFTRSLKPSVRPIAGGLHDLVSPADGSLSQCGQIEQERLLQAKSHFFKLQDLLGNDTDQATTFLNGSFLTIYLAPKDYHRVHMPIDGHLIKMTYVPGRLFSVNTKTAEQIPNLFSRNERVIAFFDTAVGRVAVILVGAMIVGSIETVWSGTVAPCKNPSIQSWQYDHPIHLKRGEEMGRFKLGSTVIVLFERNAITLDPILSLNQSLQMGQRIGTLLTRDHL